MGRAFRRGGRARRRRRGAAPRARGGGGGRADRRGRRRPELVAYFRSSAKPLQALPLVRRAPTSTTPRSRSRAPRTSPARSSSRPCARSSARRGATEDDLECGPEPTRLEHNCSGKHAGFLLVCRERGWPTEGYRRRSIRCSGSCSPRSRPQPRSTRHRGTGVDGCGVPTWALPLERMAHAFARLPTLEAGADAGRDARAAGLIRGRSPATWC